MGQYIEIINTTKKQIIKPHGMHTGAKFMESVGFFLSPSTALMVLLYNSNNRGGGDFRPNTKYHTNLIGSWAGDNIVIQGDYAEPNDQGYINPEELEDYEDISRKMFDLLS